jgi:hypothetical protein
MWLSRWIWNIQLKKKTTPSAVVARAAAMAKV